MRSFLAFVCFRPCIDLQISILMGKSYALLHRLEDDIAISNDSKQNKRLRKRYKKQGRELEKVEIPKTLSCLTIAVKTEKCGVD